MTLEITNELRFEFDLHLSGQRLNFNFWPPLLNSTPRNDFQRVRTGLESRAMDALSKGFGFEIKGVHHRFKTFIRQILRFDHKKLRPFIKTA